MWFVMSARLVDHTVVRLSSPTHFNKTTKCLFCVFKFDCHIVNVLIFVKIVIGFKYDKKKMLTHYLWVVPKKCIIIQIVA